IHKNQTDMKNRLNKAGADIGDINGFIVSQSHDADKMRMSGKQKWIDAIKPKLDLERSFGGTDDIDKALSSAFEALVTGIREAQLRPQGEKLFQFTAPSNLGKKISQSRELIFKTADDFMDYNDVYGRGNLNESLERGIRYAARNIALLERFGTNPQAMLDKIKETTLKNNREKLSQKKGGKINETLIKDSIDLVLGNLDHSVNPSLTRAVNNIKAYNNLRLLGGNILSALSDLPSKAFEYRYQGRSLLSSTLKTFTDFKAGFQSKQEQLNFASLTGVYVDSFIGDINARFNDSDDISSKMGKSMRFFSKINGMNWWDRTHRISMAQTMSHDLALKSHIEFDNLDVDTKRNLGLYDITADDWNNIRNSKRNLDDKDYIFSEDIENRQSAEKLMSYYIDRVNSGVITQTGSTRARMAMGARRGTPIGEASQLILQFKSFMFAHVERVWGRAVYGKGYPDYAAMAQIIIMSTIFGYISVTAKDFVRGKTPRDPFAPETIFASMAQGGGLGIAGDLAFQDSGGFGKSFSDILAGPTFGTLNDAYKLYQSVKEGNDAKANAFRVGVGLIPGQNLFYVREPLNHVMLYNIQEMLNPGSLSRMVANTKKDRNQDYFINPN
ncbi:MAG: hypothetical protein EBU90_25480, partial [Proteobacteria bacterium]|nr:hypothetical protein [Pseudomonadota bacterium]